MCPGGVLCITKLFAVTWLSADRATREADPSRADRGDQPLLAANQVLTVSAPRARDPGGIPRPGPRHHDPGRARRTARPRGSPRSRRHSGLHHQCLPGLPHRGSLPRPRCLRGARGIARHVASGRGSPSRGHDRARARRRHLSPVPRRPGGWPAGAAVRVGNPHARGHPADPPGSDSTAPLPGAELDRGVARLPAPLLLLLQGRILHRRPRLLHTAGGRRPCRDRAAAR